MDAFDLRDRLVSDYRDYTRSFIKIRDPRIKGFVDDVLDTEGFWPEPLLQLNPTFRSGGTIDDLVAEGVLHEECSRIFRTAKSDTDHLGKPLLLHRRQREAILQATEGRSCVLTTGAGSGKSLAYIVPIVDHVLRRGSDQGIRAIVVYPMNALANSQDEEIGKFLCKGYPEARPPVRFARYTGQERGAAREAIRSDPPDVLLTNHMMLELLLTRSEDRALVRAAQGLRFLVFDELHTYRGRQGADVAMLIRRCRHALGNGGASARANPRAGIRPGAAPRRAVAPRLRGHEPALRGLRGGPGSTRPRAPEYAGRPAPRPRILPLPRPRTRLAGDRAQLSRTAGCSASSTKGSKGKTACWPRPSYGNRGSPYRKPAGAGASSKLPRRSGEPLPKRVGRLSAPCSTCSGGRSR